MIEEKQPLICIITLSYNQNQYTIPCINSILDSDYFNFKLLLVDNGSSEDNYFELKKKIDNINDQRIILERIQENRGYVGGINFGLNEARKLNPKYIVIMNNDVIVDRIAFSALVKTCRKYNDKAIVSGKVYEYENKNIIQYIGAVRTKKSKLKFNSVGAGEVDRGQYDGVFERDMIDDVLWLIPAKIIDQIGLYSKYYWFNYEQADFALKAKKQGYKLIYTSKAKLWHKGSVSVGGKNKNPYKIYWSAQGRLIFRYLHASSIEFLKVYFKTLFSGIYNIFFSIFLLKERRKNKFLIGFAKIAAFLYFHKWILLKIENKGFNPIKKHI